MQQASPFFASGSAALPKRLWGGLVVVAVIVVVVR